MTDLQTLAPDSGAAAHLRRSRRVVVLVALLVAAAGVAGAALFRRHAAAADAARVLLVEVQAQAQRQNALRWRAIAEGRPSPQVAEAAGDARVRVGRAIARLTALETGTDLRTLLDRSARFTQAQRAEFRLLGADSSGGAAAGGRERALGAAVANDEFVGLQAELGRLGVHFDDEARRAERVALLGSILAGLLAAVIVAALFSRYVDARSRGEALAAREAAARESEARFRSLVQHSSDAVLVLDREGALAYASPSSSRVLGLDPSALTGRRLEAVVHPDDARTVREVVARWTGAAAHDGAGDGDAPVPHASVWRVRDRDGNLRHVEAVGSDLLHDPAVAGLVLNTRDVTERVALEERLTDQAFNDPLTRLPNRALFRRRVEHALARTGRPRDRVAALFIDLDKFKTVNDSLGHGEGDRLLSLVAERLLNATRGIDTVARLGGDEFAVLLENVHEDEDAVRVARRIVASLETAFTLGTREVVIGASVGVARAHADDTAEDLLRNADVAMYVAKGTGGSTHRVFRPEMHAAVVERLDLEARLREDLDADALRVAYQPIVELGTGAIVGVEALARWTVPGRGPISPATFIPIAEETGLIVALGEWVLTTACRDVAAWLRDRAARRDARPLTLSVNLSARQLVEADVVEVVARALATTGLPASALTLEITESVLMANTELMLERLHALKRLGVRLALDDFGTGYSSLSYLQRFPIDLLKIDKAFTQGTTGSAEEMALAEAVLRIGGALGMRTVAEGVEQSAQIAHLRGHGCELGQGYLFSPPVTSEALGALLRGGRTD